MSKPKILIINNGLAGGGIERASVSLANYFVSLGYKIDVVALYKSEHFFPLDARIFYTEPTFSRKFTNRNLYVLKMLAYMRKSVKKIKPDVILAFGEWTNPFVIMAVMSLNIPIYVSDRMNPMAKLPFVSENLRKIFYKHATGIIAQTNYSKEVLSRKTNSDNIRVIPNPLNVINRIDCEVKKRIVSVGRLSPEKGHKYLLEAFSKIEDSSWDLSIVGDGIERSNLERLSSDLKVSDRVIFHGHLKDFSQQLSEAQIFVLPSIKEGFPNALIEAMSLPLACISTDFFTGHNEILQDGVNGLLIPPADVKALTNKLNTLISDQELRLYLAKNAYNVRENLAFEKIANKYLSTLLEKV